MIESAHGLVGVDFRYSCLLYEQNPSQPFVDYLATWTMDHKLQAQWKMTSSSFNWKCNLRHQAHHSTCNLIFSPKGITVCSPVWNLTFPTTVLFSFSLHFPTWKRWVPYQNVISVHFLIVAGYDHLIRLVLATCPELHCSEQYPSLPFISAICSLIAHKTILCGV